MGIRQHCALETLHIRGGFPGSLNRHFPTTAPKPNFRTRTSLIHLQSLRPLQVCRSSSRRSKRLCRSHRLVRHDHPLILTSQFSQLSLPSRKACNRHLVSSTATRSSSVLNTNYTALSRRPQRSPVRRTDMAELGIRRTCLR